jgi:pseudouridine-5'-phosphate glycosidase
MRPTRPPSFRLAEEVSRALESGLPVVALESTVITHGLPYPENLELAEELENELRLFGVTPATVGVVDGVICIGLNWQQMQLLASRGEGLMKISVRDFAPAVMRMASGGTTVAGTLFAAHQAGIRVFATGGIGGVHHELNPRRKSAFDISADLPMLSKTPMIVVCAGAKAILDLPATLEYLETWGVPVVGYQTDDFPAFYSRKSGLKTSARADSADEVVFFAQAHWATGMNSAVLVTVPPPEEMALAPEVVKDAVQFALEEARAQKISGQKVTPFLLKKVNERTGGNSLRTNLELLRNNAEVAGLIARQWVSIARGSTL